MSLLQLSADKNPAQTDGDAASVTLDTCGGRMTSLIVGGHELLAPVATARLQAGCYPMVPWAGRLAHGRFTFDGTEHETAVTLPPHAIHGLGVDADWEVTGPGTMALDLTDRWALGGQATVSYRLSPTSLTATLTMTATTSPLPAVLGWHPCFNRSVGGASDDLSFRPAFWWVRGDDYLPTGEQAPVPPRPWDDCFGGVDVPPRIQWSDVLAVTLRAPTTTWVVFDELDTILCVEPQTSIPNAFNLNAAAVLEPGASLALPLEIAWG